MFRKYPKGSDWGGLTNDMIGIGRDNSCENLR